MVALRNPSLPTFTGSLGWFYPRTHNVPSHDPMFGSNRPGFRSSRHHHLGNSRRLALNDYLGPRSNHKYAHLGQPVSTPRRAFRSAKINLIVNGVEYPSWQCCCIQGFGWEIRCRTSDSSQTSVGESSAMPARGRSSKSAKGSLCNVLMSIMG